jgi:Holliday junction resolvasome RuvABC DNA-binding subunit
LALGYSEKEVMAATKGISLPTSVSDGIKEALKLLAK